MIRSSKDKGITWFDLLLMETIINKVPLGIARRSKH
jgi:hypothetical protein